METTQSHESSTSSLIDALNNDSDSDTDVFIDCVDQVDSSSTDDEISINSKPLEVSLKDDDDASSARKQTESDDDESHDDRRERRRKEMEEFREEMRKKKEMRHQCIKKLREEMLDLREKLASEIETNANLRETLELSGVSKTFEELADENKRLKVELAECQMFLQTSNSENINRTLENKAIRDQVRSLKEAIIALKEMLKIRECQVDQMKSKLTEIESSFAEKETKIMSTALQQEYQRQLDNIRHMRELYEERATLLTQERDSLKRQLDDKELDMKSEIEKSKNLAEYVSTLENNLKLKNDDIARLESEIGAQTAEKAQLASEMSAVNQLIAQVLFGFNANGSHIDMDKLIKMLEQNRDLLNEMAIKEDYQGIDEGSFLPKLLYDLFLQVEQGANNDEGGSDNESFSTPEEIAEKLPKVWRVLIELLSHHKKLSDDEDRILDDCYKSVQTVGGAQSVLSVSKTFIKLKDLILEKRSLQKDTTRLKTLYSHLEQRLDKQEKRLSNVSLELTKTWHLVGKIKRQNRQLHTHEQILCYQLQQKRRLLNELKTELEYCRKKWALARALNNESEEQCKQLRHEFSMRKIQDQNSAESGYSDEHPSDDEAGPSKKISRAAENLMTFDRTASPSFSDRRRSESPLIPNLSTLGLFGSRAASEPPAGPTDMIDGVDDCVHDEVFEVLDLIPDPIQERCIALPVEEPSCSNENRLVVTPPPEILVFNPPPKLKAHLRKHKKRKTNAKKTESAEEMYMRLIRGSNGDSSSYSESTTTASIEEEDLVTEDVEEIQEIPMDEGAESEAVVETECGISAASVSTVEKVSTHKLDPEPSTSASISDISALTTKEQEYLQRREDRLKRLEADAQAFYERMARNKDKGVQLNQHINDIHSHFLERHKERSKSEEEKPQDSGEPSTSGEAKKKVDGEPEKDDEKQ